RLDEVAKLVGRLQLAVLVHAHEDRRDLEQRVGRRIEAAGLDVDDDRKEAAEPLRDGRAGRLLGGRRLIVRAHRSATDSANADGALRPSSSSVKRTPKPVASVGTCARPPLCSPAARSTCTQAIDFGTKRDRKRAARM